MGKSQKKRKTHRHNPVRVPDTHIPKGLAAAAAASKKSNDLLPIIQKLESTETQDRVWACAAISNVIHNDPSTRRLLQGKNIVGSLILRLSDSEAEVVAEAAGAIRNLCIDAGHELCSEAYNKGILKPLQTCISNVGQGLDQYLQQSNNIAENAKRLVTEFADNVITIVSCLCLSEASNKAFNAVNEMRLVPFLMSFLQARHQLPIAPVMSAAQCLYVLSEENPQVIETLRTKSEYISTLAAAIQTTTGSDTRNGIHERDNMETDNPAVTCHASNIDTHRQTAVRLYACGVIRNLSPLPYIVSFNVADFEENVLLPYLVSFLAIRLPEISSQVTALVSSAVATQPEKLNKPAPRSDHRSDEDKQLEAIEQQLSNLQVSLEILTGISASWPTGSGSEINETGEGDDSGAEDGMFTTAASQKPTPSPITTTTFLPVLVPALVLLSQPTDLSFPPTGQPAAHPPTTASLSTIHVHAFECLNNLFFALASKAEDVPVTSSDLAIAQTVWTQLWTVLMAVGYQQEPGQERRVDIWEAAVGALWAIARICKSQMHPETSQVHTLMELCEKSSNDEVKVKCIGTLECLAQTPTAVQTNLTISSFFVKFLQEPNAAHPEPTLQVVSAVIDIFSDEALPYDINFRQNGLLEALKNIQDPLQSTVRGIDRRRPGGRELRARGDEILANLEAFISYRAALNFT